MKLQHKLIAVLGCVVCLCLLGMTASARETGGPALIGAMWETAAPGELTYATLSSAHRVSSSDLQLAADLAAGENAKVFYQFDTLGERGVVGRVTVNPRLAPLGMGAYDFTLSVAEEDVRTVRAQAEALLGKPCAVIRTQHPEFGMYVVIAARPRLDGMATDNLRAYSYDPATGELTALENANCYADAYGYVHLQTRLGGYIILCEG